MSEAITSAAEVCGGAAKLASILGATPQTVSNWRKRGVPIEQCVPIERATGGKVLRWHLRPDDWHLIWPELVQRDDAPPVPAPAEPATTAHE